MSEEIRKLPDSEWEVMEAVWSCTPPVTRAEIAQRLSASHPMAETTLLTLLTRLAEKGFVQIEKTGRRSVYVPLISRHRYLSAQSRRFFRKFCGGNVSAFASALCDSGISKEELEELRRLLKEET